MVAVASPPKASVKAPALPIGTLIDKFWQLREQKKQHEAAAEAVSKEMAILEEQLVEQMGKDGLDKASGKKATVSFSYSVVADVQGDEGWNKFYAFIKKHNYFHLLHRRVTDAAYKELLTSINGGGEVDLLKAKKQIPGVMPFIRKRVNLRTISS